MTEQNDTYKEATIYLTDNQTVSRSMCLLYVCIFGKALVGMPWHSQAVRLAHKEYEVKEKTGTASKQACGPVIRVRYLINGTYTWPCPCPW